MFYAFDILHLDGQDLTGMPLVERKRVLKGLLGAGGILRFSDHFDDSGAMVLDHACRLSLEGIVSKLGDAPYRPGRSKDWLKSKCSARQEFVVAGYVPSTAAKNAIGSLVMGVYEDGGLTHVGRVGTGYSAAVARDLFKRLKGMEIDRSPAFLPEVEIPAVDADPVKLLRPWCDTLLQACGLEKSLNFDVQGNWRERRR